MDTMASSHQMQWWSSEQGTQYGDTKELVYTRHTTYPTIAITIGPMFGGPGNEGVPEILDQATHDGSTKMEYLTTTALAPVAAGDHDWRIKRADKLVDTDSGMEFHITSVDTSTLEVKVVLGLLRKKISSAVAA